MPHLFLQYGAEKLFYQFRVVRLQFIQNKQLHLPIIFLLFYHSLLLLEVLFLYRINDRHVDISRMKKEQKNVSELFPF